MKHFALVIWIFTLLNIQLFADNTTYLSANKAYAAGQYEQALKLYKQIEDAGSESADLYYNIGNTYFKLNQIPSAILYYERAHKLKPYDEAIDFNIKVANSKIVDKIDAVPEFFAVSWWKSTSSLLSIDAWAKASIFAFIFFLIMILFYNLSRFIGIRKWLLTTAIFLFVVTLFSVLFARYEHIRIMHTKEAIVFTPVVTVKSSPSENSTDLFVIHEGIKIQVLDNVGQWYEIKIANGSIGWLKSDAVELI